MYILLAKKKLKKKKVSFLSEKMCRVAACVLYCSIFRELGSLKRTVDPSGITEEDSKGNLMLKLKILFQNIEENFSLQKFEWLCLSQYGESASADNSAALSHPFLKRIGG